MCMSRWITFYCRTSQHPAVCLKTVFFSCGSFSSLQEFLKFYIGRLADLRIAIHVLPVMCFKSLILVFSFSCYLYTNLVFYI